MEEMLSEEGRLHSHRFADMVEQFSKDVSLEQFLFQDESLLWAQRLPIKYRFRSLGVLLSLIGAGVFLLLDIAIIAVSSAARSPLGFVVAALPLPLVVLPLKYAFHRLLGTQVQLVTNYRVMQVTVKYKAYFIRSLSYNCISGLVANGTTIEFSVKEHDPNVKKSSELRSMVFRGVTNVNQLENVVQRQLHSSLSEFQYPPNIETDHAHTNTLPSRYRDLLPDVASDPASVLWVSTPSFFDSHRTLLTNIFLVEVWLFMVLFSPALVDGQVVGEYLPFAVLLLNLVPAVMVAFAHLQRIDVFTTRGIAMFSSRFKFFGLRGFVDVLDYRDTFPHSIDISMVDGSGTINFENMPPKDLAMVKWPDVIAREELIFRKHCLAHSHDNNSNSFSQH